MVTPNQPKATFILGLAGSGKSYLAERLCRESGAKYIEGIYGSGGNNELNKALMLRHLTQGGSCVVEEIAYCQADNRNHLSEELRSSVPGIQIEWVCFENDLETANWNVVHRTNKGDPNGHLQINARYHQIYTYPIGAKPIRIYKAP